MSNIDPGRIADSVTASNEPDGPGWFGAGYGDGLYDNWAQVVARFGTARALLEVDVNPADQVGNVLDVEPGDAGPAQAPPWTARARARGVNPVWNYSDLSEWPTLIATYLDQGVRLPDRWWIADYTDTPHLPSVVVRGVTYTADVCQYAGGIRAAFDTSCFKTGLFDPPNPTPQPQPSEEEDMPWFVHVNEQQYLLFNNATRFNVNSTEASTDLVHKYGQPTSVSQQLVNGYKEVAAV